MSNTNQAADPSMEEILASIRRIISDDDAPAEDAPPEAASGPTPVPDEEPEADMADIEAMMADMDAEKASAADDIDFDAPDFSDEGGDEDDDDIFELTEVVGEADNNPNDEGLVTVEDQDLYFGEEADHAPEPTPEPEPVALEPEPADDRLLSPSKAADASAAFGVLADTILSTSGNSRTLEDLVKELLRPILKQWLDDNLPELVERLVRDEIERVARGGR